MNAVEIKLSRKNKLLVERLLKEEEDKELAVLQLPNFLRQAVYDWIDYSYYYPIQPEDPWKDALEALLL